MTTELKSLIDAQCLRMHQLRDDTTFIQTALPANINMLDTLSTNVDAAQTHAETV